MAHIFFGSNSDTLYVDVTSGKRGPHTALQFQPGVKVYFDDEGQLVGFEVQELARRGGLQIDELDAGAWGCPRPAAWDRLEEAAERTCSAAEFGLRASGSPPRCR